MRIPERPEVVTLCGSTRFGDEFLKQGWLLTMEGKIVLSIGVFQHGPPDHVGEWLGEDVCAMLDELHLRKIDLSDSILVLNVDGYIGDSTCKEIAYAERTGKVIAYLEPVVVAQAGRPRRIR